MCRKQCAKEKTRLFVLSSPKCSVSPSSCDNDFPDFFPRDLNFRPLFFELGFLLPPPPLVSPTPPPCDPDEKKVRVQLAEALHRIQNHRDGLARLPPSGYHGVIFQKQNLSPNIATAKNDHEKPENIIN